MEDVDDGIGVAILHELQAIRVLLERQAGGIGADPRHVRLLTAIEGALEGLDLPFSSEEVHDARQGDHELDEALSACGAQDAAAIGVRFRALRDQPLGGLVLRRDGRQWRLERCTSCT